MEDAKIVQLYWDRDPDAIVQTADKYGVYCRSIAVNILGSHEDAEECVNDTYMSAWRAMPPHRPSVLSTFLGKLTRNLSFNRYKQLRADKRGGSQIPMVLDELAECVPSPGCVEQIMEYQEQLKEEADEKARNIISLSIQRLAAEDERIRAFRNPQNMGVARTRNFGIEQACGQFIAFLDSDDIWHADKLEKQMALAKETGAGIVYCSYAIMNAQGGKAKEDYIVPAKTDFEHLLRENVILCSAMVVRADILKKIPFNTEFYHEDFVLALDIMKAGYAAVGYTEVLMKWRYIDNSRSFDKRKAAQNRWKVYRDYLKLPFAQSAIIFLQYALAGLKKYR